MSAHSRVSPPARSRTCSRTAPRCDRRPANACSGAVDELGYRMNTSARSLKTGRTGTITLAIPDLGIDYFSDLASRIMTESERHGWAVVIEQTGARRETRDRHPVRGPAAALGRAHLPAARLGPGDERYLTGNDRLVILGDRIFNGPVDHVAMANTEAARMATQYLIDRGHTRIAAIGSNPQVSTVSAASLRLQGYRRRCRALGLPIPRRAGRRRRGVASPRRRRRDEPSAQPRAERPDAVFCFNDTLAIGALHTIATAGLQRPRGHRGRRVRQHAGFAVHATRRSRRSNPGRTRSPSTRSTCSRHGERPYRTSARDLHRLLARRAALRLSLSRYSHGMTSAALDIPRVDP